MLADSRNMRYSKASLVICLCGLALACKLPDPIRLQPTIEETPAYTSTVRVADAAKSGQLIRGFYQVEGAWRWAAPKFAVVLETPPTAPKTGAWLTLSFVLADASISTLKNITVAAKVADATLEPETFTTPGQHTYRREVPASAFTKNLVDVEFAVDKFLRLPGDDRDLALVAIAVGLEAK
jgi:hypothetical protein